ncbi:TPR_REGION domain-containing protein, partial [Haematococcus lacustris]
MGPAAAAGAQVIDDLMPTDEDLLYEEELLRNPYALKMWCRYISARMGAPAKRRYLLYERALRSLPGSYKLWAAYLKERRTAVRGMRADHPAVEALNNTYERALVNMHKMPRIWLDYLELLVQQKLVTKARRTFDRALTALPITQHDRLWILYLKFIRQDGVPAETAVRVYRRYLKLEPEHAEEYITYLKAKDRWGEAARKLAEVLDDDSFRSLEGKSKHALWLELCEIITKHPRQVEGMRVDAILRGGIRKFTDEVGRLWTSLADYYIRRGMFEKARDVFEEGMSSVITVHDFSLVFDALTQFEESLLTAKMEQAGDAEVDDGDDLDLRLARLEHLMARRPELLSSVILRQNPHNVAEWHKRVKLFPNNPMKQILTYTEAVKVGSGPQATSLPPTASLHSLNSPVLATR